MATSDSRVESVLRTLCCVLLGIFLVGCTNSTTPQDNTAVKAERSADVSMQAQVTELRTKITKWQHSRDKLKQLLVKLEQDRAGLLGQLDATDASSQSAEQSDPKTAILGDELRDILRQSVIYVKKHQDYELAILRSESKLRSFERQVAAEDAGVSETELTDLKRTMLAFDESLSADNTISTTSATLDETVKNQLSEFRKQKEDERKQRDEEVKRRQMEEEEERAQIAKREEEKRQADQRLAEKRQGELRLAKKIQDEKHEKEIARQREIEQRRATLLVNVVPPSAEVSVIGERAEITGQGGTRTVTIEGPEGDYRLAARLDGYKSFSKRIAPKIGQTETMSVSLESNDADEAADHDTPGGRLPLTDKEVLKVGAGTVKITTTSIRDGEEVKFVLRASGFGADWSAFESWRSSASFTGLFEQKLKNLGLGIAGTVYEAKNHSEHNVKGVRVIEVTFKKRAG